ncbi:MAG: DUF2088 domain-containing protein [Deltaproteobacteria bacterium]|nr:DUF2088 domain-containing protein [Deltaproteobacteria bacterium]
MTDLPSVALACQDIPAPQIDDLAAAVRQGLDSLDLAGRVRPGQRVALTAGSRGISDLLIVLKETIAFFQELGARPYVAPAMGSHGGGTAQGQVRVLAELGLTPDSLGVPIEADMAVEQVGSTDDGWPVLVGRDFTEADQVVVINRVKPHTSFRGEIESGLTKMLTIGMGKHAGAKVAHQFFYTHGFQVAVERLAQVIKRQTPLLCGLAIVENRFDKTAELAVCRPEDFLAVDRSLLRRARELMGRIPLSDVDLLIVDEMGKNVSGSGMDSNVIGRIYNQVTPEPQERQFRRIYVRDLTPETDGNALGVGTADFAARRLADKIDFDKTRINCVTAGVPEKGRLPLVYDNDRQAVTDALATAGVSDPAGARLVWIKNTLSLDRFYVSTALGNDVQRTAGLELAGPFQVLPFDRAGNLPFDAFD